jgi:simple sugar transport system permease protein
MLVSLGMTLVIATGGIDLSVGAIMAIAGAIAATQIAAGHMSLFRVLTLSLLGATAAGVLNGVLVASIGIQPIVATLILMVAGRGVAQLITDGQIPTFHFPAFEFIGSGFLFMLPFTITIVVLVFLLMYLVVRRTALGLFLESTGGNETASRFAGVNVGAIKFLVYVICGFCSGIAGLILTADIKAADANNIGLYVELDAILAVVIGGTVLTGGRFTFFGSICGALLMQLLTTTILSNGLPVQYTLVVKAAVIITVSLFQSDSFRNLIHAKRTAS